MRLDLRTGVLTFLSIASPALLVASLVPGRTPDWGLALLSAAFPVALMALGAARRTPAPGGPRRPGALGWVLVALLVILEGAAIGVLALSGGAADGLGAVRLAGLPVTTVIQVVGLWLLPLPLAALGYALTFERAGVTGEDLEHLRARAGSSLG